MNNLNTLEKIVNQTYENLVYLCIKKNEIISFPDLEDEIISNYSSLRGYNMKLRQAAWRLINKNILDLTTDLKLCLKKSTG